MKGKIRDLYENSIIRYIFFGGCTTLVNVLSFYVLRTFLHLSLNPANVTSIILAILFAYVVNSRYVFQDPCQSLRDHILPFGKFISARLLTMVIEVGGVWFLVGVLHWKDMIGKIATQILVMVLNYVFSKVFVFTTGKKGQKSNP
ncbi:hypothetical protein B5F53_00680 [Blautia sp. An249]|uniref:GtrA family protein n=1 Tax=Blautia sp. An249 TaxID=1965603 RepID=UPI000B39FF48|nr:GtrA family protein [Blautia sp. An249]OUO81127.1 hypothetical protein B5F53_00680 [Blautia sp. An249]